MASRFPLTTPPLCQYCHQVASRDIVKPTNRNGNANRPYYYCQSGHGREFITWDDARDTSASYPQCSCGFPTRRNRKNVSKPAAWFACSSNECSFREQIDMKNNAVELESFTPIQHSPVELESFAPVPDSSKSSISDSGKTITTEAVVESNQWPKRSKAFASVKKLAKSLTCGMNGR